MEETPEQKKARELEEAKQARILGANLEDLTIPQLERVLRAVRGEIDIGDYTPVNRVRIALEANKSGDPKSPEKVIPPYVNHFVGRLFGLAFCNEYFDIARSFGVRAARPKGALTHAYNILEDLRNFKYGLEELFKRTTGRDFSKFTCAVNVADAAQSQGRRFERTLPELYAIHFDGFTSSGKPIIMAAFKFLEQGVVTPDSFRKALKREYLH
jgi:hypothetical protein